MRETAIGGLPFWPRRDNEPPTPACALADSPRNLLAGGRRSSHLSPAARSDRHRTPASPAHQTAALSTRVCSCRCSRRRRSVASQLCLPRRPRGRSPKQSPGCQRSVHPSGRAVARDASFQGNRCGLHEKGNLGESPDLAHPPRARRRGQPGCCLSSEDTSSPFVSPLGHGV